MDESSPTIESVASRIVRYLAEEGYDLADDIRDGWYTPIPNGLLRRLRAVVKSKPYSALDELIQMAQEIGEYE